MQELEMSNKDFYYDDEENVTAPSARQKQRAETEHTHTHTHTHTQRERERREREREIQERVLGLFRYHTRLATDPVWPRVCNQS